MLVLRQIKTLQHWCQGFYVPITWFAAFNWITARRGNRRAKTGEMDVENYLVQANRRPPHKDFFSYSGPFGDQATYQWISRCSAVRVPCLFQEVALAYSTL